MVHAVGGSELLLEGLSRRTKVWDIKQVLSKRLECSPFCLQLLCGETELIDHSTVEGVGLAVEGASCTLIRLSSPSTSEPATDVLYEGRVRYAMYETKGSNET